MADSFNEKSSFKKIRLIFEILAQILAHGAFLPNIKSESREKENNICSQFLSQGHFLKDPPRYENKCYHATCAEYETDNPIMILFYSNERDCNCSIKLNPEWHNPTLFDSKPRESLAQTQVNEEFERYPKNPF